jgi:phosphotransferase system enzyme I (PtsP)
VPVSLLLNAGLLADMVRLDETGAEGIGLYRTEIPFMMRSAYPDVAA